MAVLKEAINDMVYKLRLFSSEVTRVSLDVGTHGKLGGQAVVTGVEGTWRTRKATFPVSAFPRTCTDERYGTAVTETVNTMARQLTIQIRYAACERLLPAIR